MDKFVLRVPKWQGELLFTKELLVFAAVIVLMAAGILFCLWGYKYFRAALFLGIGAVACYASFLFIEPVTGNPVIRLFLTVSLTFLGVCVVRVLDIILGYFLDKLRIRGALGKNIYLLAAPFGAAVIGMTIYWFIWRGLAEAAVTAVVCCVAGLVFQRFRRARAVRFKCYNDLLQLSRPETDESGIEYIAMEPAAEPEPAAELAPVVEPEPEAELVETVMPEPEAELVETVMPEPEPEQVMAAEPEPEAELVETVMPEPEPEQVMAVEPEPVAELAPAVEPEPEPEPDILEDALFVRQMNGYLKNGRQLKQIDIELAAMAAGRHAEAATTAQREAADVMNKAADAMNKAAAAIDSATAASADTDAASRRRRRSRKKMESRLTKGAAVAIAGLGLFFAGRASKGRD